jgi:hypothetical protein
MRDMAKLKFEITNLFTGNVQVTAEIECDESASYSVKLGPSSTSADQCRLMVAAPPPCPQPQRDRRE